MRIALVSAPAARAPGLSPGDSPMMCHAVGFYPRWGEKRAGIDLTRIRVSAGPEDHEWLGQDPMFGGTRDDLGYLELGKGKWG